MLFRKSEWSLKFLQAVADLGRIPEPKLGEVSLLYEKDRNTRLKCGDRHKFPLKQLPAHIHPYIYEGTHVPQKTADKVKKMN